MMQQQQQQQQLQASISSPVWSDPPSKLSIHSNLTLLSPGHFNGKLATAQND